MADEIRALTVRQPWASAIAYGNKRVENRTWRAPEWLRTVAIHAGTGISWDSPAMAWMAAGLTPYRPGCKRAAWSHSLPLGAVIAIADISGCHPHYMAGVDDDACAGYGKPPCSPWAARNQYHWVLANVRSLSEPVPCRGMLGLWRLPGDVEAAVRAQLEDKE